MAQPPISGRNTNDQFRPLDFGKGVRKRVEYRREEDPDEYSGLIDSYRDNYIGATGGMLERITLDYAGPPGWDPLDHVPEGYEEFLSAFVNVKNPEQLELVKRQIDDRLANRARREKRGFWSTFGSDLTAGIFDPSNLIASPALKGLGFLRGAGTGAVYGGALGGTQESIVWAFDPSMQEGEGRARVLGGLLGGAAFGAAFGGPLGLLGRRGVEVAAPEASTAPSPARQAGTRPAAVRVRAANITRDQSIDHVLMVLEGGDRVVNNREGAGTTKYGITQRAFPKEDIAGLTYDRAMALARKHYWKKEFDSIDPALAAVAFDANYISGNQELVNSIVRSGDAGSGLRIYRNFLNRLADTSAKHRKFKKGWNNRVDKLKAFVGGEEQRGRYAFDNPSGPRTVNMEGQGFAAIRRGFTSIYDENGNYVPAAYVRGRAAPTDEHTLVDVPERPERYETIEDMALNAAPAPRSNPKPIPELPDHLAKVVNRPAVRVAGPEPSMNPRPIHTPRDAAIELDRLERGDAEAARQTRGNSIHDIAEGMGNMAKGIGESFRRHLYGRYLKGSTKEADSFANESQLLIDAQKQKFNSFEEFSDWANKRSAARNQSDSDNLPFALERAAKDFLSAEDAAFLADVVEAKGLMGMSQPELNQLYRIISDISKDAPDAARVWMGRNYDGKKVTKGQAKKRIDNLILRRTQLAQQAEGLYERDTLPRMDEMRDALDRAFDETIYRLDEIDNVIDQLKIDRDTKPLDDFDTSGISDARVLAAVRDSWRAEYNDRIALQAELASRLRARLQDIRAERKRLFGGYQEDGITNDVALDPWHDAEPPADLKAIWAHDRHKQKMAEFTEPQLRVTIQDVQDRLLKLEKDATRYVGRGESVIQYSKKQQALFDRLTREMHDYQNRLWELMEMNRQVDDLLPFRLQRVPDKGEVHSVPGSDDPYIAIDEDAILKSFPQKPWTQSVHGLPGMAEDAFQTPEQWLNFVFFHEREHTLNPRLKDETLGEYESRINDRAYQAALGHDAPWKPVDGGLGELMLRPTPIGQLMKLVPNPVSYVWESIARLASDYDLRLQRNLVSGGASAAGGSVFQKVMRHQAKAADYLNEIEDLYLKYARGHASNMGRTTRAVSTYLTSRKAKASGKLTFEEFDRAVGYTQATGKAHEIAEVNQGAAIFNRLVKDMREQEEAVGLLPGRAAFEQKARILRGNIEAMERLPSTPHVDDTLRRWKDELAELETKLSGDPSVPGKKGLPYFTRIWNVAAMQRDPDTIIEKFRQMFIADGHDPKTAGQAAQKLFDDLVADPTSQSIEVAGLPGEMRARDLPIENDEVVDFIHQDSSIILNRYMKRNGAALEMTRAFGDPTGDMEADRVLAALEADGLDDGKIFAAMQIWYDARDRILGAFHGDTPMSTSNRVVRFAKRWTRFAVMGLTGISQLTDGVRSAWVVGPKSFAKGMFAPLFTQMEGYDPGKYAHAVGEALDVEQGLLSRRMMDDDDWTIRATESGIEKLMGDLEVPFFILNGTTPFTKLFKRAVARATPHITIDRARNVAKAIRAGKAAPEEDATWLREHGIDEHDAQLLADMPVHESKSGWITADFDQWLDLGPQGTRARDLLLGVISGNVRRGVATPGPLNRPRIMDGVMISKKEQKKAWEARWAAEAAEEDARARLIRMRKAGLGEGNAQFDAALDALREAAGAHKRARLNVGVKGRKERPFASLPLQLQSFSFSQTSKLLHSVLSGRDRHVLAGLLSLWACGIVSGWLKGEITGSNEHATLDEHLMRGFVNSGILAWMTVPLEAAKGLSRVAIGETRLGDMTLIEGDRPGISDNIGVAGPTINLGTGFLEGAFGTGFDGRSLDPGDRAYQVRKTIPFGTMIYFNWLIKMASDALVGGAEGSPQPVQGLDPEDEYGRTLEGMMGFTVGDQDPRELVSEVVATQDEEIEALDSDALMARFVAKQVKKKRVKKPAKGPLALQF